MVAKKTSFATSTFKPPSAPAGTGSTVNRPATFNQFAQPGAGFQDPNSVQQGGAGALPASRTGMAVAGTLSGPSGRVTPTAPVPAVPVPGAIGMRSAATPVIPPGGNAFTPGATDPWNGFAGRYMPGAADYLSSNPADIFFNVARNAGLVGGGPGADMQYAAALDPYADLMPYLYTIFNAGNQNFGPESFVNFAANFANQMLTPGGMGPNARKMMEAVLGNPDVTALFRTDNTANNMNAYNDIVNMGAGLSFNPMMQQMVRAQQDRLTRQYGDMFARGALPQTANGPLSYDQFFNQNTGFGWLPG